MIETNIVILLFSRVSLAKIALNLVKLGKVEADFLASFLEKDEADVVANNAANLVVKV